MPFRVKRCWPFFHGVYFEARCFIGFARDSGKQGARTCALQRAKYSLFSVLAVRLLRRYLWGDSGLLFGGCVTCAITSSSVGIQLMKSGLCVSNRIPDSISI